MSVSLRVDDAGLTRLAERIKSLGAADTRALMDDLGAEVASQTQRRIDTEKTTPDGQRWQPWSESYARTRHGNQSLLVARGGLWDSIQHVVGLDGRSVDIGSNLVYAATHQLGLDMSIVGSRRRVTIAARTYLGLSIENEADLEAIMDDFATRTMEDI
ncbi:MAG: phage virion morphogenesis protein [Pseudodesulfovibrio sp.]|uniref:Phage virion morphogenesis protein n=1 Tax=Pseudodesulfovibrio aespoeensis (strain ATCC 700646 / DSM 10631 / Aspo-2) TaxID=643562 RepID=E6VU97_PSEA9|nr:MULTISPECIES: phage virion morphogenesis protein [Pseudodesulfovibrio]MBU4191337.1 phage virion morphogenesis protein [Pseudomonadota bacterium]ADU63404.1 phage virion morphogenesis protein [Pseudodesulfovibrio aespoeensis Aspo-2]MBU4243451.1 phage virion morphogenesis protein [Pseudomonadota bacterium]MBU4378629.1 phage virion morphogenesis protein [Pseudomonadota bacterium]MBU4473785.1 phage virion morphogenesis protein [Pseudomonadota bacterium]